MEEEQKQQILNLAKDEAITLDGFNAEVYPYDDNQVMIIEMSAVPDTQTDDGLSQELVDFKVYNNKLIMSYNTFEKQILQNDGQFKTT